MYTRFSLLIVFGLGFMAARSQYYFKDIVLTKQNQENWKSYLKNKVREVDINSIDANDEPTPGFTCRQSISNTAGSLTTYTKSNNISASSLTAFYDGTGRLIKTIDTSDTYNSTTNYTYGPGGEISSLENISVETDNHISASERHIWNFENGRPKQMLKIKNETDTTIVTLLLDEKGNVLEERPVHGLQVLPTIYYYYDNNDRLTDIVRYNQKAARLLPDYVFEYNYDRISSMLLVPAGSADYQKWVYSYNSSGLKEKETCFDKKKQVVVKITYSYSFQ